MKTERFQEMMKKQKHGGQNVFPFLRYNMCRHGGQEAFSLYTYKTL